MQPLIKLTALAVSIIINLTSPAHAADDPKSALNLTKISKRLNSLKRPSEDTQRDKSRQPQKILAFTGVGEGQHVLDFFAGGGWHSKLCSKAVGPQGKVYVQNDKVIWRFAEKGLNERTKGNRLNNLVRFDNMPLVDMTIPDNSLDIVFTALNYHDLFFTYNMQEGKKVVLRDDIVDYRAALSTLF